MEQNSFSIRACASYGWRATFSTIGLSIGILLTIIGVHIAFGIISGVITGAFIVRIILAIFSTFIASGMNLGFVRIALDLHDKGTSKIMRLFSCFRFVLKMWLASIVLIGMLLGVLIIIALLSIGFGFAMKLMLPMLKGAMPNILMVFVGIFFVVTVPFIMVRTSFFTHRIVDKNAGPIESVLYSFRATKGLFWKIFGLFIIAGLSSLTIIGIPAGVYMVTAAYRKLSA